MRGSWGRCSNRFVFVVLVALFSSGIDAGEIGKGDRTSDIPLLGDPINGRINLVGYPLRHSVSWTDVLVVDGRRVLSLEDSDPVQRGVFACGLEPVAPACIMSRVMHRWNGNAWQAFNGITPGMEGVLDPFDAFLVTAMAPGISLRIPTARQRGLPDRDNVDPDGWQVRLIAESGTMKDEGNLVGQIASAIDGFDMHDLEELPPLGERYLSIVFENGLFPESDWGYTSDFRSTALRPWGEWPFVVRASDDVDVITLSWEGDDLPLYAGWLIDLETGEWIRPYPGTSYSYLNGPEDRKFMFALYNR